MDSESAAGFHNPRMMKKIETSIEELETSTTSIESLFNGGVVEGFTQESVPHFPNLFQLHTLYPIL